MGYHTKKIPKGKIGEFSKIKEEFLELKDAYKQKDLILVICELTDLYGAIECYVEARGFTMKDLKKFSDKTKSSFKEGKRK